MTTYYTYRVVVVVGRWGESAITIMEIVAKSREVEIEEEDGEVEEEGLWVSYVNKIVFFSRKRRRKPAVNVRWLRRSNK